MARILCVEDDYVFMGAYIRAAQVLGHEVIQATTYSSAEKALKTGGFDVVLTDINFPAMPGERGTGPFGALVVDWLRRNRPEVPYTVISSYTLPEALQVFAKANVLLEPACFRQRDAYGFQAMLRELVARLPSISA